MKFLLELLFSEGPRQVALLSYLCIADHGYKKSGKVTRPEMSVTIQNIGDIVWSRASKLGSLCRTVNPLQRALGCRPRNFLNFDLVIIQFVNYSII